MRNERRLRITRAITLIISILLLTMDLAYPSLAVHASDGHTINAYVKDYHVLFLSSYNENYGNVPREIEGLRSVFDREGVELDIEFMDAKRFPAIGIISEFKGLFRYKMEFGNNYDLIITGDDDALQFVMDNQKELFFGKPILFLGVDNQERVAQAEQNPYMAGVAETSQYYENIRLAQQLTPGLKEIVAITDSTMTGQGNRDKLKEAATHFPGIELKVIDTSSLNFAELAAELESVKYGEGVIFFLNINRHTS